MTIQDMLLVAIILCCIGMLVKIMYDYLMGTIAGELGFAFGCITVSIGGLSAIQLIT